MPRQFRFTYGGVVGPADTSGITEFQFISSVNGQDDTSPTTTVTVSSGTNPEAIVDDDQSAPNGWVSDAGAAVGSYFIVEMPDDNYAPIGFTLTVGDAPIWVERAPTSLTVDYSVDGGSSWVSYREFPSLFGWTQNETRLLPLIIPETDPRYTVGR